MELKHTVTVRRRFQRSIRLDTDLNDANALKGFICPPTFAHALATLAQQSNDASHGAFTWTGPFGGGKSSLAVVLAALLSPQGSRRNEAKAIVGESGDHIIQALRPGRSGFSTLAVVGRKQDAAELVAEALKRDGLVRQAIDTEKDGGQTLLQTLLKIAKRPKHAGLVVFIDEMGKVLEAAAQGQGDLHFLQELAELASRSERRLIVIGILHQSFGEYNGRLARRARDEWMKVQGRFVDIPLATVADEQLALLSQAIESQPPKSAILPAEKLAAVVNGKRAGSDTCIAQYIQGCWPVNPVTASLLGPFSRRRFGQNQRSIFSFLNSAEPRGFQDFLSTASSADSYDPAVFWDYLRDNLEPSILASPDGHRWSTALDALERCQAKGGSIEHLLVSKTIAIIDQFREQAGFYASKEVIEIATPGIAAQALSQILADLEKWSIVVFRRHLGAYAVHAGSDFEIEPAIREERERATTIDYEKLQHAAGLQPVVAKRHYHQTGALHWLDIDVAPIDEVLSRAKRYTPSVGSLGVFLLALPSSAVAESAWASTLISASQCKHVSVTAGLITHGDKLVDLAQELAALERIRDDRAELSGDAVARREVSARIDATQYALASALFESFLSMTWYHQGTSIRLDGLAAIHRYASTRADETFPKAPRIQNELVNRTRPSSTAVAARRQLMYAMVNGRGQPRLGIEGFPAEAGLYTSLLDATGLYGQDDMISPQPTFLEPGTNDPNGLAPLWHAADELLAAAKNQPIALSTIYRVWTAPPYGIRAGLLPVLSLAYMLSRNDKLALYLDAAIRPTIDDLLVDRMQQEPDAVQLRLMDFGKLRAQVLRGIQDIVTAYDEAAGADNDPLVVARRLVAIVINLPMWTRRTASISEDAQRLRALVMAASDPHRFLFDDLPGFASNDKAQLTKKDIANIVASIRHGLEELVGAYPAMLASLHTLLLSELGAETTADRLAARAANVFGLTGDLRLDAFATRLMEFSGADSDVEGIASLAVSKPPRDWIDRDLDAAKMQIAELAQLFNRSEAFARVKGRTDQRHAIAFVVGLSGSPHTTMREFIVDEKDIAEAAALAEQVKTVLSRQSVDHNIVLAALAQIGAQLIEPTSNTPSTKRLKKAS